MAALAQMKQDSPVMQNSYQSAVLNLNASPVSSFSGPLSSVTAVTPSLIPATPVRSSVTSPQTLCNVRTSPLPRPSIRQTSTVAKNLLHSHCPSTRQGTRSPLVKVASSPVPISNTSGPALLTQAQASKSPGRKIVTVSKLPTSEQISALLQQLHNSPQTALSKLISSAANSLTSGQLVNGSDLPVVPTKDQPLSTLPSSSAGGASVGKSSLSCLVSNGQ